MFNWKNNDLPLENALEVLIFKHQLWRMCEHRGGQDYLVFLHVHIYLQYLQA